MKKLLFAAAALLLVACNTKNERTVEGASAEIDDIVSRIPQNQNDADKQIDEYVRHIEDTWSIREDKVRDIEGKLVPGEAEARGTVAEFRDTGEPEPRNQWSRRLVSGRVSSAGEGRFVIDSAEGERVELQSDRAPEEGAQVRAAYEMRDGEKVVTDVEVISER